MFAADMSADTFLRRRALAHLRPDPPMGLMDVERDAGDVKALVDMAVIDFGFVGEKVAVGVGDHGEVVVADVLTNSRPGVATYAHQLDPPMP